jgi:hypothetical protein
MVGGRGGLYMTKLYSPSQRWRGLYEADLLLYDVDWLSDAGKAESRFSWHVVIPARIG